MPPIAPARPLDSLLGPALRETHLARREIRTGHFQRSMVLIAALSAIVSGFESYTQHLRGAFNHWLMWTPVVLTPPTVIAAAAALCSERLARRLLPMVALVALLDGVVGFLYHIRGIRRMPGGLALGQYNVVMGPPIFAPLLMGSVGVVAGLAGLLRREQLHAPGWRADLGVALGALAWPRGTWLEGLPWAISHGRFQQLLALTSAVFAVLAGGEAYFEHLRGSFNQRWMWTPIWVTPPMVAAAIGAAISARVAREVLPLAATVTLADGLLGFFLHLRGLHRMPGGFLNIRFNVVMGPPLFAPLLFCSVGLLGLIASLLRRRLV